MLLTNRMLCINPWVDDFAEELQIADHECFIAHKVDDAISANFCFCLSFGQLVMADVRAKYRHTLVVHESNLPKGRGCSSMSWQILEGQNRIPITLFETVDKVDAGSISLQEWIDLNVTVLSSEWRKLQAEAILQFCLNFISTYPGLINKVQTQAGEPTFYPKHSSQDSQLDLDKTLSEQFSLLRIVDNEKFPAFFELNGDTFILKIESTTNGDNR